jgi:hypothetical protein
MPVFDLSAGGGGDLVSDGVILRFVDAAASLIYGICVMICDEIT